MSAAPELPLHTARLHDLVRRFRSEESHLVMSLRRLQAECDVIANELAHVRLALEGARGELDSLCPAEQSISA